MKRFGVAYSTIVLMLAFVFSTGCSNAQSDSNSGNIPATGKTEKKKEVVAVIDSASYKARMIKMANGDSSKKWKFNNNYPKAGAILPFNRVIAYYGNLYSTRMGILGELPKPQMFAKLKKEIAAWQQADPETPVIPALHYIVATAQASPGDKGLYRLRMPFSEIDKIMAMAKEIDALVFLDVQVGLSNLRDEIPVLEKYLKNPKVHLGIDPEFSMKGGEKPGSVIGSFDAADVNYVANYLTDLVNKHNLPPKILVLHRFTQSMLKNTALIEKRPEIQFVVDMDGWGAPSRKIETYKYFVAAEPVQFTGFKLFYKNDLKHAPNRLLTPAELLSLKPVPMYIQYQ